MSDISITITADPNQAVQAIDTVKKKTVELSVEAKKVAQETSGAGAGASQQVLTATEVTNALMSKTITQAGDLGGEVRTIAKAASSVSGAFGESIPVIGKLGGSLQAVLTGPIGAITAAVTGAIMLLKKMADSIQELREKSANIANATAKAALDDLNKGREEYKQQLELVKQIRQISEQAKTTPLSQAEMKQLSEMAVRARISPAAVTSSGIDTSVIDQAAQQIDLDRSTQARDEYYDYMNKIDKLLIKSINDSKLNDTAKKNLLSLGAYDKFLQLENAVRTGAGTDTKEQAEYTRLFDLIKPLGEVRETYRIDPLLGRNQAELDRARAEEITSGINDRQRVEDENKRAAEAAEREAQAIADAAEREKEAAEREAQRRAEAGDKIIKGLENQAAIQELINSDKKREAFILQQRLNMESALGRTLTEADAARIEAAAGALYDLRNPAATEEPSLVPPPSRRTEFTYNMPLDRLQRIGANVANPVASAEKITMDRQLTVQESIRDTCRQIQAGLGSNRSNTLVFP